MAFSLHRLGALDLDRAAALHDEAFVALGERGWTRADFAGLLASPGVGGILLIEDKADAGLVLWRGVADEAELLTVAVRAGHRRKGAGRLLLRQARGERAVAVIDSRLGDWFCALSGADERLFLATTEGLAARLKGQRIVLVGAEADALGDALRGQGIEVAGQPELPDAATLGRLALAGGIEAWRVRNAHEGMPRPLYLRGVSITSPDGTRRTVE